MTPEYSDTFEQLVGKANEDGIDLADSDELLEFVKEMGLSSDETELLKVRQKLSNDYGANDQFLGIGLTKDVNAEDGLGVVETYSLDKKPGQLKALEDSDVLTRIALTSY